jgi:hypothetical protein
MTLIVVRTLRQGKIEGTAVGEARGTSVGGVRGARSVLVRSASARTKVYWLRIMFAALSSLGSVTSAASFS